MSRRKAKKMAKKNQAKAPTTAMSEAMEKAKNGNNKSIAKPKPNPKEPVKREIIGFGKADNGTVIHAITNKENSILCDTRRKNYVIDLTMDNTKVNCVKCLKFRMLYEFGKKEFETIEKPIKAVKKVDEKKPKIVAEFKPTEKEVPKKALITKTKPAPDQSEFKMSDEAKIELLKKYISNRITKIRADLKSFVKEKIVNEMKKIPLWFITRKSNGRFQIVHERSRYVFTDNLTQDQAEELIIRYSEIPIQWDGVSKIPGAFLSAIRRIHDDVLQTNKTEVEKKPTLKQRKKIQAKPKATIKRRSQKTASPKRVKLKRRK